MIYILDTNVISAVRRSGHAPQVAAWLSSKPDERLFLSAITLGEIARGIRRQEQVNPEFAADLRLWLDRTVTLFADRILPFGPAEALIWGRLSHDIGHDGADLMIAATALAQGATVVTGNTADFLPSGCLLENPF